MNIDDTLDDIDDAEVGRLFGLLARSMRTTVARRLLAGNDTGSFTTEQYRDCYDRTHPQAAGLWIYATPESHLQSIPNVVREVSPGVWAAAELVAPKGNT